MDLPTRKAENHTHKISHSTMVNKKGSDVHHFQVGLFMFSLKKELGIAKVICKPLVLVPKTAQKSCLSKLGEMAHV